MALTFAEEVVVVPRSFRIRFWSLRDARWLVPAGRCFTLPLAVRRKRFLVPLCVFCLGMAMISNWQNPIFYRRAGIAKRGTLTADRGPLLRREDHDNPPAVHLRGLFELGVGLQLLGQPLDQLEPFVDV